MNIKEARDLLQRYERGATSAAENQLIEQWYETLIETGEWQWDEKEKQRLRQLMEYELISKIGGQSGRTHVISFSRSITRIAASIILVLAMGAGAYFMFHKKVHKSGELASHDVLAPNSNRAILRLSNGQVIYLDSAVRGALATIGNVNLVKLANGEIAYRSLDNTNDNGVEYNTLINPRGSQVISIVLSDQTKIWLNAGSSLSYPVVFAANERKISISGEAYFEVSHDPSRPFLVSKNDVVVKVLGTHFNVNAYDDEKEIKITLLEGAVKVNKAERSALIKPGQQAQVAQNINIRNDVDIETVMAWKNGYFKFDKTNLQDLLKQLSRWYDVDIVDEVQNLDMEFAGEMERGLNLSEVLRILEKNDVHFRIEGKKIIVKP